MLQTKTYSSPFDFYDFFGYLFPGFMMFIYIFSFIYHHHEKAIEWHNKAINYCFSNVFTTIFIVVLFIVGVYVIGHLIATIGSLILDRVFMIGVFGFPYNFLLDLEVESEELIENSYKLIFLFFNSLIVITLFEFLWDSLKYVFYFVLFYLSLILLIFIVYSSLNKARREKFFDFLKKVYAYRILYFIPTKITNYLLGLIKILVNNNKPFPKEVIEIYAERFKSCFGINYETAKDDNIWLPYFYVTSQVPIQEPILRKWHHLYGYSRNICCASFIYIVLLVIVIHNFDSTNASIFNELLIVYVIGIIFYMRYINLFQNYLLKNVFRSFISIAKLQNNDGKSESE